MALPSPTTSSLRQRRGGMKEVVQELDAFVKIADDAIEEPKASKGIRTYKTLYFCVYGLSSIFEY
jgi:hypothetical protein